MDIVEAEMTDMTPEVEVAQLLITKTLEVVVVTDPEAGLAQDPQDREVIATKDLQELLKVIISNVSSVPVTQDLKSLKKTPLPRGLPFRRDSGFEAPLLMQARRPSLFTSATYPTVWIRTS